MINRRSLPSLGRRETKNSEHRANGGFDANLPTPKEGLFGTITGGIWIFFMLVPAVTAWKAFPEPLIRALVVLLTIAFCITYFGILYRLFSRYPVGEGNLLKYPWLLATLVALCIAFVPLAGANSLSCFLYLLALLFFEGSLARAFVLAGLWFAIVVLVAFTLVDPAGSRAIVIVYTMSMLPILASRLLAHYAGLTERHRQELMIAVQREALARDVHDLLAHSLTAISLKSQLASRLLETDPASSGQHIEEITRLANEATREVREAVIGIGGRPFAQELAACSAAAQSAGITVHTRLSQGKPHPVFSWVLREAFTNALRHSGAGQITVQTGPDWISISDDGVGIKNQAAPPGDSTHDPGEAALPVTSGQGLTGLRKRVGLAGGRLEVSSGHDGGTTVEARFD